MDNNLNTIPQMRKITEIAEMYNLPVHFVRSLVNSGKVVATRVGNKILVNVEKFSEYLNSNTLSDNKSSSKPQDVENQNNSKPRLNPISK